ncbi:MAG: hypothetical protein WBL93_07025 [Lutisporaceae bacterium]
MSDKKRDNDKKEKFNDMEEMHQMGMREHQHHMQHMCPMLHQCPMSLQCPMAGGQMMQQMPMMPMQQMPMQNMPGAGMRIKDWFDEWDEFSEDSSFEFDSDDFEYPEKYYKKLHKKHKYPYYGPPFFPFYK